MQQYYNCYNCKKEAYDKLCKSCSFNPDITIFLTDVKKKFKLTEEELKESKIFSFTFTVHRLTATKYLIRDIIELIGKLTKNADFSDKRKLIYEKQKHIYKNYLEAMKNKPILIEQVKELITRLNHNELINFDDDKWFTQQIDEHCKKENFLSIEQIGSLVSIIEQELQNRFNQTERRKQLDDELKKHFPESFIEKHIRKGEYRYDDYIKDGNYKFDKCINQLVNAYANRYLHETREEELIKELEKHIPKTSVKNARHDEIFYNYRKNGGDVKEACAGIIESINIIKQKQKRRNEIYRKISSYDGNIIETIQNSNIYKNYIENGNNSLKEVLKEITDNVKIYETAPQRQQEICDLINKCYDDNMPIKLKNYLIQKLTLSNICMNYVKRGGDINTVIDYINERNHHIIEFEEELKKLGIALNFAYEQTEYGHVARDHMNKNKAIRRIEEKYQSSKKLKL